MPSSRAKRRSNLKDVARKSNVSVATVSRVLNSPDKVSTSTRERVLSAIEELRFVRSAAARAINSGRSRVVGALIPTLDNAIFARVLDGLEDRLSQHKLSLIVATTEDDPEIEAQKAQELIDIGAEGLVASGIHHSATLETLLDRAGIPMVSISYYSADYHRPTVGYDNHGIARMALNHLYELNHRSIAVIHGPRWNNDRTRARIKSLESSGLPIHLDFYEAEISIAEGCSAAIRALASGRTYTACMCLSDVLATGALYEFQRQGLRVPEDISVTGMEDLPSSSFIYPSLTTVHLPVLEMGEQAAETLANWLEHGEQPEAVLLPSTLMVRQSTAAAPK